jgi:hypothetical protein
MREVEKESAVSWVGQRILGLSCRVTVRMPEPRPGVKTGQVGLGSVPFGLPVFSLLNVRNTESESAG